MITTAILVIIYVFVDILIYPITLLPTVTLQSGFGEAVLTSSHYLANIADIIPLVSLFSVLGIIIAIELGVMIYKIIMWIIRRVPTQS